MQVLECAFNPDAATALPEFLERFAPALPRRLQHPGRRHVLPALRGSSTRARVYVPHMVFIDRAGMIRADYPGESEFFQQAGPNIRAELDKLLAK